jgi:two-component system, chemotaxis family, chemotaxis protein CheY
MPTPSQQVADMHGNIDVVSLKLPATLDSAAAEGLLDALRRELQAQPRLRIDASGVETLTLPCAQVILAALRTYDQLSIEAPSAEFTSAFTDFGFDVAKLCPACAVGTALAGEGDDEPDQPDRLDAVSDDVGAADNVLAQTEEQSMAKRILTIDDSKTIRDMLMLTLAGAGFEVVQAIDGQDGLDVLDREEFDVVITDINMPRMDGYEVIRQMRSNSAHKTIPILVLTTESEADKKNMARVAGATGWMVKPFDPDRLIETINKVAP